YLGFDLERELIESIPVYLEKWGTHPSWSRLLGSPVLYEQIEERLAQLLGAEDTLVLPTITLIHMSVIPVLAGAGTIYVESRAHKTIYEGCQFAASRGATVKRFKFEDAEDLERLLKQPGKPPRLICVDGIRADLWRKTNLVLDCLDRLGVHTPNHSGFPIIEVPLARHEDIDAVGRFLFENGIYVTLAAYPLVPRDEVGFRIQVTAANTDAEIENLLDVLSRLTSSFDLQPARNSRRAA